MPPKKTRVSGSRPFVVIPVSIRVETHPTIRFHHRGEEHTEVRKERGHSLRGFAACPLIGSTADESVRAPLPSPCLRRQCNAALLSPFWVRSPAFRRSVKEAALHCRRCQPRRRTCQVRALRPTGTWQAPLLDATVPSRSGRERPRPSPPLPIFGGNAMPPSASSPHGLFVRRSGFSPCLGFVVPPSGGPRW